jgi:hypothetical protein
MICRTLPSQHSSTCWFQTCPFHSSLLPLAIRAVVPSSVVQQAWSHYQHHDCCSSGLCARRWWWSSLVSYRLFYLSMHEIIVIIANRNDRLQKSISSQTYGCIVDVVEGWKWSVQHWLLEDDYTSVCSIAISTTGSTCGNIRLQDIVSCRGPTTTIYH